MEDIYHYLIFKLDSECADFEFDLIPIPPFEFIENNLSLEPYEYFGETVRIFDRIPKQIVLYYNADILRRVRITFKGDVTDYLTCQLDRISVELPNGMNLSISYFSGFRQTILLYEKGMLGKN
ncbi:hypothetical protein [Chryseobacterium sp. MP_3.2]|uniref:hypothetical protein n=1 Tax=Chryseobacterium sp. MP_3.2 TaxID=3071712 RepID=UPI002DFBF86B|nr:hypothetical protein [Chryseobacterium sp. MP_3.2]